MALSDYQRKARRKYYYWLGIIIVIISILVFTHRISGLASSGVDGIVVPHYPHPRQISQLSHTESFYIDHGSYVWLDIKYIDLIYNHYIRGRQSLNQVFCFHSNFYKFWYFQYT